MDRGERRGEWMGGKEGGVDRKGGSTERVEQDKRWIEQSRVEKGRVE